MVILDWRELLVNAPLVMLFWHMVILFNKSENKQIKM